MTAWGGAHGTWHEDRLAAPLLLVAGSVADASLVTAVSSGQVARDGCCSRLQRRLRAHCATRRSLQQPAVSGLQQGTARASAVTPLRPLPGTIDATRRRDLREEKRRLSHASSDSEYRDLAWLVSKIPTISGFISASLLKRPISRSVRRDNTANFSADCRRHRAAHAHWCWVS